MQTYFDAPTSSPNTGAYMHWIIELSKSVLSHNIPHLTLTLSLSLAKKKELYSTVAANFLYSFWRYFKNDFAFLQTTKSLFC